MKTYLWLCLAGAFLLRGWSAETLDVMPLNSIWKYNASGNDLGTVWREVNYDDSAWASGSAPLGREPDLIPVPIATPLPYGPITHYFRTTFVFPTNPFAWVLSTTNMLVDDGVVIHLNGIEVGRFGMFYQGPIEYSSLAVTKVDNAVYNTLSFNFGGLQEGTNVLAVEVHQEAPDSKDIVWAAGLQARKSELVTFIPGPVSALTSEHRTVYLHTVELSGGPFTMQWFKDGVPVREVESSHPSATNTHYLYSDFLVTDLGPSNAGNYYVVATNAAGVVTSQVASVQYIPDVTSPLLVNAVVRSNLVRIDFNEAMSYRATNVEHYVLRSENGGTFTGTYATQAGYDANVRGSSSIWLRLPFDLPFGPRYTLEVTGAEDNAWVPNTIAPASAIPVHFEVPVMNYNAFWRYRADGVDLSDDWKNVFYNDSAWPSGRGLFGVEINSFLPSPIQTPFALRLSNSTPVSTFYLRTHFDLPTHLESPRYALKYIVDDGAALYANGQELTRVRLVTNAAYTNFSTINAPEPQRIETLFPIPTNLLATTGNLLAVELHQTASIGVDIVFGAEVLAVTRAVLPSLRFENWLGEMVLKWTPESAALEWADEPSGPWELLTDSNAGTITLSTVLRQKFFRVRR